MNRVKKKPLGVTLLKKMDAYWRAANYLSVGQIYLYDNPLLKKPLKREHIKPRLLGHWGTAHAYGAAFDNPDLIVACVVGDGEAETGPLAASWHSNKFLHPVRDGAVLPILHLNGYKIAGPTVLARISDEELDALFSGYGYKAYLGEGGEPEAVHQQMAATLDAAIAEIKSIQRSARMKGFRTRPRWPMIVLCNLYRFPEPTYGIDIAIEP